MSDLAKMTPDLPELEIADAFNAATHFVDRNVVEGRGDKVAIETSDAQITYASLLELVNRSGNALSRALDVRVEERILLLLPDCPELIQVFFGAMKIGAVPIPANTLWRPSEYEFILNDCRARVLVVHASLKPKIDLIPRATLRYLKHIVVVGGEAADTWSWEALIANADGDLEAEPTSKDDAAFWLYSSGSTGAPKGCVHLHHDMPICAHYYARGVLAMSEHDRCFSVAKLFFAYGLGNAMYFPFAVGATTILWPGAPTAANVYAVIEQHKPTLLFSVPTNFAMLLAHRRDAGDFDLSSVRWAVSAGEALPAALFERFKQRFGVKILDGIGSTELLHIFISNRPGRIRPGASGLVVPGYEAKLVDEQGDLVAPGEIGNLWVKGDSTCSAYWNRHEKTKATIQGEWIRTGDKYYQDQDGYYWYAGRTDDMLKVGGIWVSPVDVENVLMEHEVVLECAVAGRCDQDNLIKPAAYVVLHESVPPSTALAQELQMFVRMRLPDYKRPRWVEFVPELPKTATGKIQRFKLRDRDSGVSPSQ